MKLNILFQRMTKKCKFQRHIIRFSEMLIYTSDTFELNQTTEYEFYIAHIIQHNTFHATLHVIPLLLSEN